jgi:abortive infection bacteriophage resistance protein
MGQPYQKPWFTCQEQIAKLRARGLETEDEKRLEELLLHIGYYRFTGYCLAFQVTVEGKRRFHPGCTESAVQQAYDFDTVLRDLLTEALEIIEVDVRSTVAHRFGAEHGPFGHRIKENFHARTDADPAPPPKEYKEFVYEDWIKTLHNEAKRSKETFVVHFRQNYTEFPDLPIWVAVETMSFTTVSKMYQGMKKEDQKPIAQRYRIQPADFETILHHLAYVRNLCAHHSRLWDKLWSIKPVLPRGKWWSAPLLPSNERLFSTVLLLFELLKHCSAMRPFTREWRVRMMSHLAKPPCSPEALWRMGLTSDWEEHPVWHSR